MRCLTYAMGGGRGHQTRARSLHRALRRLEPKLETVLLTPQDRVRQDEPGLTVLEAPSPDPQKLKSWQAQALYQTRPDLYLVDTFPRGVLGELTLPQNVACALVTRWVVTEFYARPPVRQALQRFDAVFWTEPKSDPSFPGELTPPVVDDRPVLSRSEARRALEVDERPLVLAFPWALPSQQEETTSALQAICEAKSWNLRWVDQTQDYLFRRADLYLSAADLVISPSGYNTYYEVCKHGVSAIWVPQPRKYDNQARRASGALGEIIYPSHISCPFGPTAEAMAALLGRPRSSPLPPQPWGNQHLAQRLEQLAGVKR